MALTSNYRGIAFMRREAAAYWDKYRRIRDCLGGEDAVKKQGTTYLPRPNEIANPNSTIDDARYCGYKTRAVFYNATRNTLDGMVGQVFSREPTVKLPTELELLEKDVTGNGVELVQFAKKLTSNTISFGRGGILVDYPNTETDEGKGATREQLDSGKVRPVLRMFNPEQIINWRTRKIGALEVLSLVVLVESYFDDTDPYELIEACQLRELYLDENNVYHQRVWREESDTTPYEPGKRHPDKIYTEVVEYTVTPTGPGGTTFDRIPFHFVGSLNNDPNPDNPPLDDIAVLNLAHYRNSADYEESVFLTGQATMIINGLSQDWYDSNIKGKVFVGSREAMGLPVNSDAKFLQAEPNGLVKEAMDGKERQMVALGARLVQQQTVQRTATESSSEDARATSVLSSIAHNVSDAIEASLKFAAEWHGVESGEIEYRLNEDFEISHMSGPDIAQVVKDWQAGAITFTEMRKVMRATGRATLDDDAALKEIGEEVERDTEAQTEAAKALSEVGLGTPAKEPPKPPNGKP